MKMFDLHCDTLTKCMNDGKELYDNDLQNSLLQLLKYEYPCQIFAIFTDDEYIENAYSYAKSAIDFYNRQKIKYLDYLTDFSANPEKNRVNAILSIEGGEPIESIEMLDEFYELGVRLVTLTWNRVNKLGSGALSGDEGGLTKFGKDIVRRMNKLNMVIDVSHLNERGFWDTVEITEKPIAATHSNCYEICGHLRNLKDSQIKEIVNTGGIIGVNLYPPFLGEDVKTVDILKHIEHFLFLGCENSLCLGCDFDGISCTPKGIGCMADMKKLYAEIMKTFGENMADKLFFQNAYDFWKEPTYVKKSI